MQIKTLSGVSYEEILRVFNSAFSDYLVPLQLTSEQLATKMKADGTELSLSCGVFENEQLVAFILHGVDTIKGEKVAYNGGTGVVPSKRGMRLTTKMYEFILPVLVSKGITRIVLEVITNNVPALKTYQGVGFKTKRELLCYKGNELDYLQKGPAILKPLANYHWELLESFGQVKPSWQYTTRAITASSSANFALGAYLKDELTGYIIFTPSTKRIQQIAVKPDYRRKGIASQLVGSILHDYGNPVFVINVDKNANALNAFLTKMGLVLQLKQFEMELLL